MPVTETTKTCPAVWNTWYSFQQKGLLCDVQLQVKNKDCGTVEAFLAHRLILAASSAYFEGSLHDSNQWQEVYCLDGSTSDSVNLVLQYIYRQICYSTLQSHPEAFQTAEALQVIRHQDEQSEILLNQPSSSSPKEQASGISSRCAALAQDISTGSSSISKPQLVTVGCQTDFDNMKTCFLSPADSKVNRDAVASETPTRPKRKSQSTMSNQSKGYRTSVVMDKPFVMDKTTVAPTVDGVTGLRRSGRTPKLSQKMKEYAKAVSELTESVSDNEAVETPESEVVLSYTSPTVKVYTVQQKSTVSSDAPSALDTEKESSNLDEEKESSNLETNVRTDDAGTDGVNAVENRSDNAANSGEVAVDSNGLFRCAECPQQSATQSLLDRHVQKMHRNPHKWTCEECLKTFMRQTHFINHMKQVHKKAPFECKECKLQFRAKSGFLYHKSRHHDKDDLRYKCEECGKKFFLRSELTSHMMFKHSNERPFSCELCHRAFKHKKDLHRHTTTYHSDSRAYSCDECDKAFKTQMDLKKHKKLHEKGTSFVSGRRFPDGLNYPCSFCNKIFTKRSQQKTHERLQHTQKNIGTSYLCTACNRSFAIKHYLMQHIKHVHTARRHQCPKCEKMFMQNHDLHRHQKSCKGQTVAKQTHICPNCHMGFTVKGNLTKHMQIPGRCKWRRKNISDLVVLVQDGSASPGNDIMLLAETAEVENEISEESAVIVQELEINSEDAGACVMSLINVENGEGVEMPVILQTVDGREDVIDISNYPGAELILEAATNSNMEVDTVKQMPVLPNEENYTEGQGEQILITEEIDSENIVIANGDDTPLEMISETEIVTHPDIH